MIRANASRYPISAQCRILGVPRSTYYWMIEHPETERADPIAGDVRAIWRDSRERYGARKIKAALERKGVTASRRRIGNIMHEQGMTSAYVRRRFKPHRTRADEARLANLLDREFDGYEPRTHLAGDLTCVRVGGKWAYVCLLIDLANRSIAGHSADTSRTADLVMAAFATLDFPLTEVEVFHTDRGGGFDNAKIDELLDVFDIRRSLSRKGDPYGNAVVESTNRLLKKELIYRNHYTSLEQLRSDLNDYVWWFNNQRLHSTLGYRSPKEFTEQGLVL
ncbi:IS3 family transposase [Bifidobacterium pseudocatenulatum]|nr:IS3 family transposase [Bifidobacterium pseudocatenulatum]UIY46476.1 IS3 family transposase [Bifidobacterium pseudocatenulatum]